MKLFVSILCLLNICFITIEASQTKSIPRDSLMDLRLPKIIPYHSFKDNVVLDGILNDTIPMKALLDIGAWGIAIPDRLRKNKDSLYQKEEIVFKVGDLSQKLQASYMKEDSQFLRWYGGECVLLGWDFFENKILKISYKDRYIKVLKAQDLKDLSGYDCVKFKNRGKRLLIPARVDIQGKRIEGDFWIDTGLNGVLFFNNNIPVQYNLDVSQSRSGRAKNLNSDRTMLNVMNAEAIRIGNSYITNKEVFFTDNEWFVFKENELYLGLIGNQFFKHFSVVFDFRENNLYLKRIDN